MGLPVEDQILVIQRFVDNFQKDLLAARDAIASLPEPAQRFLVGGLNYALDHLDMFPDHHKGIGMADDAIVLRLAAKLAFNAGGKHPDVERLATDANLIMPLFEDLAGPLEKLVATFPDRNVRGRTTAAILAGKDARISFEADIGRDAKRHAPHSIGTGEAGARAVKELHKMFETALKRANLV
jgi:uncharacterized membrane protein YkvA (DUF1232 family)